MRTSIRIAVAATIFCAVSAGGCSGAGNPGAQTRIAGSSMSQRLVQPSVKSSKRDIYYYQTQYSNGIYVSLSPIWAKLNPVNNKPYVTDLIVAAFHLGYDSNNAPYIHLNDNPPSDPMFDVMWPEVATLQGYGVTARMMLGGAAQGSYAVLFSHWNVFYPILKQTIVQYKLNGIDLDVEETVSLHDIKKLITRLNADFGDKFLVTLVPVSSALSGGSNLSGFSYDLLYHSPEGAKIAWFDAQFYSGFGSLNSTADYDNVVAHGYPADLVVAGTIANPADGFGYLPITTVTSTVKQLVAKYPKFGGVFAWEYFNALPGGPSHPAKWAAIISRAMSH
jgi:hypothetical protein